jgi:hypothetical protein
MPTLSADALLVIAQWKGRPDAALHLIHDVCVPAGRIADRTMIPAVEEVSEAGLTENVWEGLRLTDAGRAVLAALPSEDAYDPEAARFLEGMPMPRARPAGFVEDALDVPPDPGDEWPPLEGGPGGVPGGPLEPAGEPGE